MVTVAFACNDHRNGHFCGRMTGVCVAGLDLDHDDWERGCAVTFLDGAVRISRRAFKHGARHSWWGNWCWERVDMEPKEARRLLRYLWSTGTWNCTGGPDRLYRWWQSLSANAGLQGRTREAGESLCKPLLGEQDAKDRARIAERLKGRKPPDDPMEPPGAPRLQGDES